MRLATLLSILLGASLLPAATAWAQDDGGGTLSADDLPPPSFEVPRIAPSVSYEFGMHMSYGTVTYWRDFVPSWIGFGARFAGGKNFADHRLGGSFTATVEGPFMVHTSVALEPHGAWDFVDARSGLQLGFGLGPSLMYHWRNDIVVPERAVTLNPGAEARIGYSQSWTRVGRRLYCVLEPKLRYVDGAPNPLVALVVGSGTGK